MGEVIPLIPDPIYNMESAVWVHRCKRCHCDYQASHQDMSPLPANVCPSCITEGEVENSFAIMMLND